MDDGKVEPAPMQVRLMNLIWTGLEVWISILVFDISLRLQYLA